MMNGKEKNTVILLAAGQGKRMNSDVPKQYLLLGGKPVLFYSLDVFEKAECIDEIILVVGNGQVDYCKGQIVEKYNFKKVKKIIEGGAERYLSVYNGIKEANDADNIFVHDGARPFVEQEVIQSTLEGVRKWGACVVGVPVKDTIKISNRDGFAEHTPERSLVWAVQTPQVFQYEIIMEAYDRLMANPQVQVTDDAMVVEKMLGIQVKLIEGSYKNIKITTPEDLIIGEVYVK